MLTILFVVFMSIATYLIITFNRYINELEYTIDLLVSKEIEIIVSQLEDNEVTEEEE